MGLSEPLGNFSKNEGHELTLAASILEKGYEKGRPFRVARGGFLLVLVMLLFLLREVAKSKKSSQGKEEYPAAIEENIIPHRLYLFD